MPLYEFRCPECGSRFEELVWTSGGDKVVCPQCGNQEPVREMSTFATCGDGGSSTQGSSCGGSSGFS
ncbi:MAG: zinc ribbon domain-containing protein [Pseudomonadota bacterium]